MRFYVVDIRDQEPRRSRRAQGPYTRDQADQCAAALNDFIMRNAGLRPQFRVVPASQVAAVAESGSVLVVNGAAI